MIGADGGEYGPITAEQLRSWAAENRVRPATMIKPEGTSQWKPLSAFPEFSALCPPVYPSAMSHARNEMKARRTGGMTAVAVVNIVLGSFVLLTGLFAIILGQSGIISAPQADTAVLIGIGLLSAAGGVIGVIAGIGVLKLRPWGKAMTILFVVLWIVDSVLALANSTEESFINTDGTVVILVLRTVYLAVLLGLFNQRKWKIAFRHTADG